MDDQDKFVLAIEIIIAIVFVLMMIYYEVKDYILRKKDKKEVDKDSQK